MLFRSPALIARCLAIAVLVTTGIIAVAARSEAADVTASQIGELNVGEGSGLVASTRYPGIFWALRDSGDGVRNQLHAVKIVDGRMVDVRNGQRVVDIRIDDSSNADWEALTIDAGGDLLIGDTGNNRCRRTTARLYRVPEPNPYRDTSARATERIPLDWTDKVDGCGGRDAEALFTWGSDVFLIRKSDPPTVYRVESLRTDRANRVVPIAKLTPPAGGFVKQVTDASISSDGTRLAVTFAAFEFQVYEVSTVRSGVDHIKALVGSAPRHTADYQPDRSNNQIEGAAFVPGTHDLVLLNETRPIWFWPAAAYGDGEQPPEPPLPGGAGQTDRMSLDRNELGANLSGAGRLEGTADNDARAQVRFTINSGRSEFCLESFRGQDLGSPGDVWIRRGHHDQGKIAPVVSFGSGTQRRCVGNINAELFREMRDRPERFHVSVRSTSSRWVRGPLQSYNQPNQILSAGSSPSVIPLSGGGSAHFTFRYWSDPAVVCLNWAWIRVERPGDLVIQRVNGQDEVIRFAARGPQQRCSTDVPTSVVRELRANPARFRIVHTGTPWSVSPLR